MKIAAGCRIDAQCRMHLLRRRWVSEGFPDLNAMREALSRRAEFPTGDLTDFGRGAPAARAMMLAALAAMPVIFTVTRPSPWSRCSRSAL